MGDTRGMEIPDVQLAVESLPPFLIPRFGEIFCRAGGLSLEGVRGLIADPVVAGGSSDEFDRYIERRKAPLGKFSRRSLDALGEEIRASVRNFSLLHAACANESVSLEIVEAILDLRPDAAYARQDKFGKVGAGAGDLRTIGSSYPLHAACWNPSCPLSVVKLLAAKNPHALRALGLFGLGLNLSNDEFIFRKRHPRAFGDGQKRIDIAQGTPLHYYLQRGSNLTAEGVKFLVEACPNALRVVDKVKRLNPLHTLALNPNLSDHFGVVSYLVQFDPSLLQMMDSIAAMGNSDSGNSPIHHACCNGTITLDVITCLIKNCPESIRKTNWDGRCPLHCICQNSRVDDPAALDIIMFLVHQDPTILRKEEHAKRHLPIHLAAGEGNRNKEFCQFLINHFPESVREPNRHNLLPLHEACKAGRLEVVKYLYEQYPQALALRSDWGWGFFPVHLTVYNETHREEIFEFIKSLDPGCFSLQSHSGNLPLHMMLALNCPQPEAGVKYLFDEYPESILTPNVHGELPLDTLLVRCPYNCTTMSNLLEFFKCQYKYSRKARGLGVFAVSNQDGRLLLHQAAFDRETSLGMIKLILKGNPSAVRKRDMNGLLPAHLACCRSSRDIVQYLLEKDKSALVENDASGYNLLHLACRSGNCGAIHYILAKSSPLVSLGNDNGVLPIHLLCDKFGKNKAILRSAEYLEAIWRLLLVHPESVSKIFVNTPLAAKSTRSHKRKSGEISQSPSA